MITPQQFRNPQVKPKWQLPVGVMESVVAYNCRKYGMPRPVLAMPMWEGAGNRAMDLSGHGNHGVLNGPDWVAAGVDFDGTNDYVDILDSVAGGHDFIGLSDNITISAWINPDVVTGLGGTWQWTVGHTVVELRQQITTGMHCPFGFGIHNSKLALGVTPGYISDDQRVLGSSDIQVGVSQCVAFTIDGDDYALYLDGDVDGSGTFTTAAGDRSVGNTTCNLQIGIRSRDGGDKDAMPFNGSNNGLLIFNTTLLPAQVKFLHDNPYFMYEIPEELYGRVAAVAAEANPYWYYQMLKRRN